MIMQSYLHIKSVEVGKIQLHPQDKAIITRKITLTMDSGEDIELTLHAKTIHNLEIVTTI